MSWEMPKTDVQYDIFNISIEVCESPCSYNTNEKNNNPGMVSSFSRFAGLLFTLISSNL